MTTDLLSPGLHKRSRFRRWRESVEQISGFTLGGSAVDPLPNADERRPDIAFDSRVGTEPDSSGAPLDHKLFPAV
jgi:hypothetical protein